MEDSTYPRCFGCNTPLIWQNDFMRSEVGLCDEDADENEDAIVSYWSCPHCHTNYEIQYPSENELKEYREYETTKTE